MTDNQRVAPSDYDPYCVTAPVDPRLPDGGGYKICGLYDIRPDKFGQTDNVVTLDRHFGQQTEVYDGVDILVNARLGRGIQFQGGTNTGRISTNRCFTIDSPQEQLYCDVVPPYQTQVKLSGIYPLPWWGLRTSAAYQTAPGPQVTASWAAPVSAVEGLGRPISGNAQRVTVPLISPGTMYGERLHQLDVRAIKDINVTRQVRLQLQFDVYNVFNGNTIIAQNNTYGTNWQQPQAVLAGRLFKFGTVVRF